MQVKFCFKRVFFFIMTGKHPFEMQKVRKDLFLSLEISENKKIIFSENIISLKISTLTLRYEKCYPNSKKKRFLSNFLQHIRLRYGKPCYKLFDGIAVM